MKRKSIVIALPFILCFLLFYCVPYVFIFKYAFSNKGIYFSKVITNTYFERSVLNTICFSIVSIISLIIISYLISLLLKNVRNRFFMILLFIPVLIPSSSCAIIWEELFKDGTYFSFILLYLWKNIGLISLIISTGLLKIPNEVYDAALIDGANMFQIQRYIVLPLLSPVIVISSVIGLFQSFKIFREIYLIYGIYPPDELYMIPHFIFNKFNKLDYQELSAGTLIFMLITICLFAIVIIIGYILFLRKDKYYEKK